MRRGNVLKLLASIALALVVTASVALAATKNVGVKHKGQKWHWNPSTLTIKKGATVKWKWSGNVLHNVTGKGFHSKNASKLTFKHRFTNAGTYKVVCTFHQSLGQKMTIRVK